MYLDRLKILCSELFSSFQFLIALEKICQGLAKMTKYWLLRLVREKATFIGPQVISGKKCDG